MRPSAREFGNDAIGEGPRALDGGNSGLHPTHHCRRRRQQDREATRSRRRQSLRRRLPPAQLPASPRRHAPPAAANNQSEIDAMLADLEAPAKPAAPSRPRQSRPPPSADVLDLTEAMAAPPPPRQLRRRSGTDLPHHRRRRRRGVHRPSARSGAAGRPRAGRDAAHLRASRPPPSVRCSHRRRARRSTARSTRWRRPCW